MKTAHIFLLAVAAGIAILLFQAGNLPGVSNPVSTDPRPGGSGDGGSKKKGAFDIMPVSTDFDDVVMTAGGSGGGSGGGSIRERDVLAQFDKRSF